MLKTYLKIAWRNLTKNKTFTLLNLISLSVAFCAAVLLSMSALFELSFDNFHKNQHHVYKLYNYRAMPKGPNTEGNFPAPLAPALKEEVAGIQHIARTLDDDALISVGNKDFNLDVDWADPDFFSIFSFPVIAGSQNPLPNPSAVAITQKTANKLFGKSDVLGKTIKVLIAGEQVPFTVSAVLENIPKNSSLDFDLVLPFTRSAAYEESKTAWNSWFHQVYVQLEEKVDPKTFEANTATFFEKHFEEDIQNAIRDGALPTANNNYMQAQLFPLKDLAFRKHRNGKMVIDKSATYLVLGIAFLILLIACVNFVNMSIAKIAQRLKEIGMQKTLGAPKKQLFLQLWTESILIFTATMAIGFLLSYFLLNPFKTLFNTDVSFKDLNTPWLILATLASIMLITFIAGGYPAMIMARFGIIPALKGKFVTNGKNHLRNGLVVFQFAVTVLLISATLVLYKQLDHMRTMDLGFNKEAVISIPLNSKLDSYQAVNLLRNELAGHPSILSVGGSDNNIGRGTDGSTSKSVLGFDYKNRNIRTNMLIVEPDFVETLGLELLQGRDFDRNRPADSLAIVINEKMAKELQEENPLATTIMMDDSVQFSVIGVLKDYHFERLNKQIEPLTLFMVSQADLYYAFVKVAPTDLGKSMQLVKAAWQRVAPNAVFMGSFLDENIDRTFTKEKNLNTLISSGAILAIVLSCIGLFALSLLVVNQRTKEIGIRKVVGANLVSLTFLLTKDFLKLVLLGFIIAAPIAWYFAARWLEAYPFRTSLSLATFLVPGFAAIVIAFVTIGAKTIKAASQNPTKSLRTE